jgi:fatty-acyl-CoA synthase
VPVRYYDWIAHHARRTPGKTALVDLGSDRRFTYADLDARVARLAGHLRKVGGVGIGDRVAVLALNSTDTLEGQFACFRLGAIFVPLNSRLTVPELQFIVGDAAPKLMIHDGAGSEPALQHPEYLALRCQRLLRAGDCFGGAAHVGRAGHAR